MLKWMKTCNLFRAITKCSEQCVGSQVWSPVLAVFSACTDCVTHLSFVLSGSSARSCFCVLCTPICASRYRGLPLRHLPFRVICGLAVDGSASRSDCEQPRQLHCFCRCYGSSRRGDRTICVAEDSAPLWLTVEALFACLLFAVLINLRCTRIWILPLLPDLSDLILEKNVKSIEEKL